MPLSNLIAKSGAIYGPETLKAMTQAFDEAWAEIEPHFESGGLQAQTYRLRLAKSILAVATENSTDAEILKNEALAAIALDDASRLGK